MLRQAAHRLSGTLTSSSSSAVSPAAGALPHLRRRLYNEKVLDHYDNPRNVGAFGKNHPSVGTRLVGAPACGDVMKLQIRVDDKTGKIFKSCFKTFGCGSAIASSSVAVVHDVKKTLSKSTDDKASQDALANVFRAAEAVEEFTGIITSLKMAIDDSIGLSGEDVKPMPEEFVKALQTIYKRYDAYLESFGPEEGYLKKKVENELGTKMTHLKMRWSGLNSDWGKVTVLGTSGLAGSYIEQRA